MRFHIPVFLASLAATVAHGTDGFVKMDFDILQDLKASTSLNDLVATLIQKAGVQKLSGFAARDKVPLTNERTFYVSKLSIGSPVSEVQVLLDTGSSDLWVMSSENPYCTSNGGSIDCDQYGTFNETASSTFKNNQTNFHIQYLDDTFANGTWGTDDISLTDSLKLQNASFAVAEVSDSNVGVFGIGFIALESGKEKYLNVPALMKEQGLIKKVAYSLYLGSMESNQGNILFGAIDHAKYSGELKSIDISKQDGQYPYLQIPLTEISVQKGSASKKAFNMKNFSYSKRDLNDVLGEFEASVNGGATGSQSDSQPDSTMDIPTASHTEANPLSTAEGSSAPTSSSSPDSSESNSTINTNSAPALLDSGTTLSLLPQEIMDQVIKAIDPLATYNAAGGGYLVNCTLALPLNTVTFTFDGEKDIVVPMTDLIMARGSSGTGGQTCLLGLIPGKLLILGDNFLRSAYSVFNLDDKTISIAQLKFSKDEKIEVIN